MTPRAVLIGLPGAGKSSTGRRLAKVLAVEFADSDDLVEVRAGRTVATIFAELGEPDFRVLEAETVASALADFDGILSLGGGALTTPAVRDALAASSAPVVLLHASVDTLTARVGDARTRPLLRGDPAGRLTALAGEREALYRSAATMTVPTDGFTPGQVAATIAARLHERSSA